MQLHHIALARLAAASIALFKLTMLLLLPQLKPNYLSSRLCVKERRRIATRPGELPREDVLRSTNYVFVTEWRHAVLARVRGKRRRIKLDATYDVDVSEEKSCSRERRRHALTLCRGTTAIFPRLSPAKHNL